MKRIKTKEIASIKEVWKWDLNLFILKFREHLLCFSPTLNYIFDGLRSYIKHLQDRNYVSFNFQTPQSWLKKKNEVCDLLGVLKLDEAPFSSFI